jgi:hypothetical protein
MTATLAVVAEPDIGPLAGIDGEFEWGTATTVSPEEAEAVLGKRRPDLVVALGDAALPGDRAADLRMRVAAPDGDEPHSRAALPVRDDLFDLPMAADGSFLVVSRDAERRDAVVDELVRGGTPGLGADSLTRDGLAGARVVAFLGEPGQRSIPASAPAVLAARRLLVAPPAELTFGLEPGSDHLVAIEDQHVLEYAPIARGLGRSLETFTAFGRVTAELHRASVVYGRLALELAS